MKTGGLTFALALKKRTEGVGERRVVVPGWAARCGWTERGRPSLACGDSQTSRHYNRLVNRVYLGVFERGACTIRMKDSAVKDRPGIRTHWQAGERACRRNWRGTEGFHSRLRRQKGKWGGRMGNAPLREFSVPGCLDRATPGPVSRNRKRRRALPGFRKPRVG